jgi:V/A-type H+-transporting ATPase subunit F
MPSSKLAFLGERATVVAFEGLGISTFAVDGPEEARETLSGLIKKKEHAVIFVTEDINEAVADIIAESAAAYFPSVVLVPSSAGSRKIGLRKLSRILKNALGADILKIE